MRSLFVVWYYDKYVREMSHNVHAYGVVVCALWTPTGARARRFSWHYMRMYVCYCKFFLPWVFFTAPHVPRWAWFATFGEIDI